MDQSRQRLLQLVRALPPLHLQNALMRCSDRDLALAVRHMTTDERQLVLAPLAGAKRARVLSEPAILAGVRVTDRHCAAATETVISALLNGHGKPSATTGSYLRPRRPDSLPRNPVKRRLK